MFNLVLLSNFDCFDTINCNNINQFVAIIQQVNLC